VRERERKRRRTHKYIQKRQKCNREERRRERAE